MQSLRILQVLTPVLHPNGGGVQMSTCKLARYFMEQGFAAAAFSFGLRGHSPPEGLSLFCATEAGSSRNQANIRSLVAAVERFQPDIVINHMPYDPAITDALGVSGRSYVLVACLRNTLFSVKGDLESFIRKTTPRLAWPALLTRPGRALMLQRHRLRHAAQLRSILASYDRFIMFGPPNLDELRYFVPDFDPARVALIPNSIPVVADSLANKQTKMLWLGRIARAQKRVELIPEIWRQVSARLPDWELDVVGEGPDLDWLKSQAQAMKLDRISFHGRQVPDEYFSRASIFLMTSSFEGFPNTLVEAQSRGAVPVIFDSYPVAHWIVENGQNGWLIEPFDTHAMSHKLVELAQSPVLPRMGAAAIRSAERFLIANVGTLWKALFAEELARKTSSGARAEQACA